MSKNIKTSEVQIPKHNNQYINEKYDKWLIKLFIAPSNNIRLIYNRIWNNQKKYPNIINYIFHRYIDAINPIETLRRIQYNIEIRPICKVCGNPVKFKGKPDSSGLYTKFCCPKCSTKFTNNWQYADLEKMKQTKLERYGSIGYNNREKAQQTNIEKYGSKNHIEKIKETKLEKYGDEYYRNPEKAKETLLKNYGVDVTFKSEEIQKKIKESNLEKYGVDNPFKSEEIRQKIFKTNQEKYGYNSPLKNDEILDKIKETNISKFGAQNPMSSPEIRFKWTETLKERHNINENKKENESLEEYHSRIYSIFTKLEETQKKIYNTHKKNHSFNTSKPETYILKLIKEKYTDIIFQYTDRQRYPFHCDYYIPSLDLFIEYQGHQGHGYHPYDPHNQEDQNKLNKWIKDNEDLKRRTGRVNTRYDGMIYCWTIRDPHKREIAKQNNLNYLEIWPDWSDEKILQEIEKFNK